MFIILLNSSRSFIILSGLECLCNCGDEEQGFIQVLTYTEILHFYSEGFKVLHFCKKRMALRAILDIILKECFAMSV